MTCYDCGMWCDEFDCHDEGNTIGFKCPHCGRAYLWRNEECMEMISKLEEMFK